MSELKRDKRIGVRLNKAEDEKLNRLANKKCQTPSQWIRDRITQARLK